MIEYENECVGCSTIFHNCMGTACPHNQVPHYYCDECGEEFYGKELYWFEDRMLCKDCLVNEFEPVVID